MDMKLYRVAWVITASGLNSNQEKWAKYWLDFSVKIMGEDSTVKVIIPGFTPYAKLMFGLPGSVWNRPLPPGAHMAPMAPPSGGLGKDGSDRRLLVGLMECDEIWCFPTPTGTNFLNRSRPASIFRLGIESKQSHKFKWIPPWIECDFPVIKKPKTKTLKGIMS